MRNYYKFTQNSSKANVEKTTIYHSENGILACIKFMDVLVVFACWYGFGWWFFTDLRLKLKKGGPAKIKRTHWSRCSDRVELWLF